MKSKRVRWSGSATWASPCARLCAHPGLRGARCLHAAHRRQEAAEALAGAKRYSNYDAGARRAEARRRLDQHVPRHARRLSRSRRWRRARTSSSKSRSRKPSPRPSASSRPPRRTKRKLVIGYILRHHPVVDRVHRDRAHARHAARLPHEPEPAVERRAVGDAQAPDGQLSPIVDCGVHYVDIWCQMTPAKPVRVHAMGAHLTDELRRSTITATCRSPSTTGRSAGTRRAGAR